MINQVTLIGNLGADPESKTLPSGKAVTNFRMATKNYNDTSEWHQIVAFDKLAEIAGKYLVKGKQVYVQGRIQTRQFEGKNGTQYRTEIVADNIKFLSAKSDGEKAFTRGEEQADHEDDLPF